MRLATERQLTDLIRLESRSIQGVQADYDPLLDLVGTARLVLLGEATHGTHEFYAERARITARLIEEKGFHAVAVEADWPDAYRVNRFVRGASEDPTPDAALAGFRRFPTWMWRNREVLAFIQWLRAHNDRLPQSATRVGFYGLDLYSLHASIDAVIHYLQKLDPAAARRARFRYSCFDQFGEDTQAYGYAASFGVSPSCEDEVVNQLRDLQRQAPSYAQRDGQAAEDEYFYAEQNARLAKNAERYYRAMFARRVESWNLRDRHMAETLAALIEHLDRRVGRTKVVVWEHNSHLGDARATQMGEQGELNVGQLVRQRYGTDAVLVGFTTATGTVTAASNWDEPAERKRVRPPLPGSYERLFHSVERDKFLLLLRGETDLAESLRQERLERAIGVVYRPQTERISHYFDARLADQFDAVLHFDQTRAVEPLEPTSQWTEGEVPETYPSGV